jgi:hypothetical protein
VGWHQGHGFALQAKAMAKSHEIGHLLFDPKIPFQS